MLLSEAWLGQFAFLELWAGLPCLLLELEMVLPLDTFSQSALNLAVFQPLCALPFIQMG